MYLSMSLSWTRGIGSLIAFLYHVDLLICSSILFISIGRSCPVWVKQSSSLNSRGIKRCRCDQLFVSLDYRTHLNICLMWLQGIWSGNIESDTTHVNHIIRSKPLSLPPNLLLLSAYDNWNILYSAHTQLQWPRLWLLTLIPEIRPPRLRIGVSPRNP